MILEVLLAAASAGVLVVLIAWGVSCAKCTELQELPEKPIPMEHEHGTQGGYTLQNLKFDARRCTSIPYDSPQPGTARQLQRLAEEGRPGACLSCGFENACAVRGCALLRSVSKIVAVIERK